MSHSLENEEQLYGSETPGRTRGGVLHAAGIVILIAGALMVAAAVAMLGRSLLILRESETRMPVILSALKETVPDMPGGLVKDITEMKDSLEIPVMELDGVSCAGILTAPALNMEWPVGGIHEDVHLLPVIRTDTEDDVFLTIEGMDYDHQFTPISMLSEKDRLIFTDMNGMSYTYRVAYAGSAMGSETGWDLKLITYNWRYHPYTVGCVLEQS